MSLDASEKIASIVLAAGAGSRFGFKPKSLLQRDGEALLARQLRLLRESGVRAVVVVLGHHAERIEPVLQALQQHAEGAGLRWVVNPAPDDGPGSSLRCGLAALDDAMTGVLVVLGDQPLLERADFEAIVQAWRARAPGIDLVVPTHQGQPGHPLVFGAAVRQAVQRASGAAGVREWRRAHPDRVQALAQAHARCTTDIDTEEDLARLAAQHGVALTWPQPQARS